MIFIHLVDRVWCLGESVDPVADLCPTNQFLYRKDQSGTAE